MKLFLKTVYKNQFCVNIESDATVDDLLIVAAEKFDKPEDNIRMVFCGTELKRGYTCTHYQIQNNSTIYIVERTENEEFTPLELNNCKMELFLQLSKLLQDKQDDIVSALKQQDIVKEMIKQNPQKVQTLLNSDSIVTELLVTGLDMLEDSINNSKTKDIVEIVTTVPMDPEIVVHCYNKCDNNRQVTKKMIYDLRN